MMKVLVEGSRAEIAQRGRNIYCTALRDKFTIATGSLPFPYSSQSKLHNDEDGSET